MQSRTPYALISLAALAGGAGVALAAIAAHRVQVPALATAANVLMIHGGAIAALVGLDQVFDLGRWWRVATAVLLAGVIIFSGAIAVSHLLDLRAVGALAPFGGSAMIAAWLALAVLAAARSRT